MGGQHGKSVPDRGSKVGRDPGVPGGSLGFCGEEGHPGRLIGSEQGGEQRRSQRREAEGAGFCSPGKGLGCNSQFSGKRSEAVEPGSDGI